MTRILREAAESREELERARLAEDRRLADRQAQACLALIASISSTNGSARVHAARQGRSGRPPATSS